MGIFRWSPARAILVSYVSIIVVATALFMLLPTTKGEVSLLDALFTVTSAVTVTGLVVLDTGRDLTPLGQFLVLFLIQIGGLGYMTITTFLLVVMRRKIGIRERLILSESLNYPGIYGLVRFLKRVVIFVILVEFVGFLLLTLLFMRRFEPEEALFYALFHSISAFNNAGFSLFSDSLEGFRGDLGVNIVIMSLIILGGIGFFVINELYLLVRGRINRISTHTKMVLVASSILILGGGLLIFLTEIFHHKGLWSLPVSERVLSSLFLSVSSRTAGFSTLDLNLLSESTIFLIMLFMLIGASPGGTGGGVKTSVFAVVVLAVLSYIRGRSQVVVFERRISESQVHRAMVILVLSILYIGCVNLLIDRIEEKDFLKTIFEVMSAFTTTGLSLGRDGLSFSAEFSPVSKFLIILSMLVGRVGILSFAIALMSSEREERLGYPEARLLL